MAVFLSAAAGFGLSWWSHPPRPALPSATCETQASADPAVRAGWRLAAADAVPLGLGTPSILTPERAPGPTPAAGAAADMRIEFTGSLRLSAGGKPLRVEEAIETVVYWRW